ncbi:MAG: hypothetical protein GF364_01295, partial [Candidatus Lokiarchaeota archaeon]|nr:hypothetical protein [Candidatus Lokiarchaeota archaeon]
MKILFLIPFKSLNGGILSIFEHANRLTAMGHHVIICYPIIPYRFGASWYDVKSTIWQLRGLLVNIIKWKKIDWFNLSARLLAVPWIHDHFLPQADIVVASAWPTAYSAVKLKIKGEKFYFIQGYEIYIGPVKKIQDSYLLPLRKLVVSNYLARLLWQKFGQKSTVIPNGVNHKVFYNHRKIIHDPIRLLTYYNPVSWKGPKEVYKVFRHFESKMQLVMFGLHIKP